MANTIPQLFDLALSDHDKDEAFRRRYAEQYGRPFEPLIIFKPHTAEARIRSIFTFADGVEPRLTPWRFVQAWMRWQNNCKGGAAYTVYTDSKVGYAAHDFIAARQHGLVTSTGKDSRRRIFLVYPNEQIYERGARGGSRIIAGSMLTPAEIAILEIDHARRAARRVGTDRKAAERRKPRIAHLLREIAGMAAPEGYDGIIPKEWIDAGYVPEGLADRAVVAAFAILGELHMDWQEERQQAWVRVLDQELYVKRTVARALRSPIHSVWPPVPRDDLDALGAQV